MKSAHLGSRAVSLGRILFLVLSVLLVAMLASAQTSARKKTTTTAKKTTTLSASKRPSSSTKNSKVVSSARPGSKTVATHRTAAASREVPSHGTTRVQTRKVVVTRKMVHGRWVRTTQVVHTDPGPTYQTHPDTERYQQIQQALAQKGYFKGETNGQWGDDSVSALKQFQADHKLSNDGKITSLSLIQLGLGPNRETATADATPQPVAMSTPVSH